MKDAVQTRGPPEISLKPPTRMARAATPATGCPFRYLASAPVAGQARKADMQLEHAKAVSAKGVTRRPTKSEIPMMVAPMPSTKKN